MMLAYLDCFSGISGDMTLGALVNLGVPVDWLQQEIGRLPLDGFEIKAQNITRHGIRATQVEVVVQESHHHREYAHIQALITRSPFSEPVKARSLSIFERIADAESAIHGMPRDHVHFHEVGSMDAIVDVVGSCLAMEYLRIDTVICSSLPLGGGFVKCQHGTLPVPAPATLEILKGVPVYSGPVEKEMVTPTGAAIAAVLAASFEPMPAMRVGQVGYGAGTRELESQPNLLRIILGAMQDQEKSPAGQKLVMVACCIDDMNPEFFGYLMERLFDDGALDVFWVPVHMKKNRPGTMVQVLCEIEKRDAVVERIFSETTTIGVRFHEVHRTALARVAFEIETPWGLVAAKKVTGIGGIQRVVPEFEICRQIALDQNIPLPQVYETILRAAGQ